MSDAATTTAQRSVLLSREEVQFVRWLFDQADMNASMYRFETLARRLAACLRGLGVGTVTEAQRLLEQQNSLIPSTLSSMLVGMTSFFRDADVFAALESTVIPTLASQHARLHVWSAGCSDGHELYSAAMLLGGADCLERSYLLGTDCRVAAIAQARIGIYGEKAVEPVSAQRLQQYFTAHGKSWRVNSEVRRLLHWRVANVLNPHEPGLWDIIFFRNTAMYMRPAAVDPLWERLESSLRPGGILVTGKAERPVGTKRLSLISPCIYRRTRK